MSVTEKLFSEITILKQENEKLRAEIECLKSPYNINISSSEYALLLGHDKENHALRELIKEIATAPNYMTTFAWAELQQKAKDILG